jgi:hypothetical protein
VDERCVTRMDDEDIRGEMIIKDHSYHEDGGSIRSDPSTAVLVRELMAHIRRHQLSPTHTGSTGLLSEPRQHILHPQFNDTTMPDQGYIAAQAQDEATTPSRVAQRVPLPPSVAGSPLLASRVPSRTSRLSPSLSYLTDSFPDI